MQEDLSELKENNAKKDKKIDELQRQQRNGSEASDRATQSSEDLPQRREDPQAVARRRHIEEMEDYVIQLEDEYPPTKGGDITCMKMYLRN